MAGFVRIALPLLLLLLSSAAYSAAQGNESGIEKQLNVLEKIRDANRGLAESTLKNVSFLVAFLGGVLSFLAPCTVALFPAFLAFTARSGRNATLSMLAFFTGFSLSFIALGIALTYLGKVSFVTFQQDASLLVQASGIILVFLGIMMFFSKGFSFIKLKGSLPKDAFGTIAFGALFAIGWSACIGPIIAGIFTMAAVFHNYLYTALLLFFYALGLAVPLFIVSFAYDRFNFAESRIVKGFAVTLKLGKSEVVLTSTGMVSGLLMAFLGAFFILNRGTTAITAADLLGMIALLAAVFAAAFALHRLVVERLVSSNNLRKAVAVAEIFAALAAFAFVTHRYPVRTTGIAERLSDAVLQHIASFSIVSGATLVVFIALLAYFVWRQFRGERK